MQAASLQSLSASLLMTFQELPKQNECIWYSKTCARSRIHPCPTAIHSNQSWGKKKARMQKESLLPPPPRMLLTGDSAAGPLPL